LRDSFYITLIKQRKFVQIKVVVVVVVVVVAAAAAVVVVVVVLLLFKVTLCREKVLLQYLL